MIALPLLAQATAPTAQHQRAWLVTLILAVLVAFLCLLFFLLAMRLFRRGKRPKLGGGPTATDSAWAAAGGRVPIATDQVSDGEINLPAAEHQSAGEEPFWDAEAEDDEGESWSDDADDADDPDDDEPWR